MPNARSIVQAACVATALIASCNAAAGVKVLADAVLSGSPSDANYYSINNNDNYSFDGQRWDGTTTYVYPNPAYDLPYLPLYIDIGGPSNLGSAYAVTMQASGNIAIGYYTFRPVSYPPYVGIDQFISVGTIDVATTSAPNGWGPTSNITESQGILDPHVIDPTVAADYANESKLVCDPNSPCVENDSGPGLPSYRFLWNQVCTNEINGFCSDAVSFEAVITYLTSDAFVLQLNYGSPFSGVSAGFSFPSSSDPAIFSTDDTVSGMDYCFYHGVASKFQTIADCEAGNTATTPPSTNVVPEPSTRLLMLLGGLLFVAASIVRRHSRGYAEYFLPASGGHARWNAPHRPLQ